MNRVVRSIPAGLMFSLCGLRAQIPLAEIRGTITDPHGQSLTNVNLQLVGIPAERVSDAKGYFEIPNLAPGGYVLQASTPGYRSSTIRLHLDGGETKRLRIVLSGEISRRIDIAFVESGSPLEPTGDETPGQFAITGREIKNLGSVIADDPLRAVQALPSVSANDDFEARFSLRGADFSRIGVYLDGIQLHDTVHTLEGASVSGSASIFNSDLIQQMTLYDGSYPERFGDSSAGALEIHMRDGARDRYIFKIAANFADAGFVTEGPLGKLDRCSWIGGFRKSYLQYLLQKTLTDPSMAFGISDGQGRLTCRMTAANTLSLELIDSRTDLDRSSVKDQLGANSLMLAGQRASIVNLAWQYARSDRLLLTNHLAWMRDSYADLNPNESGLRSGNYREWVGTSNATWMWNSHDPLSAGLSVRARRDSGYLEQYNSPTIVELLDRYKGDGILAGGFLEQSWALWRGRLHLSASGRWDHHSADQVTAFSPQASATFSPWSSTRIQLARGQYAQFPEESQFGSNLGSHSLLPMRSTHALAAIEQRLGTSIRLRGTFYNRQDRDLLYQPLLDPRMIGREVFVPPANPLYENSLRGSGRGAEILLQRASSKGVTGWISYAYGHTWMHDGVTNDSFPSDWDQRHTINLYSTYRLRPTLTLSARWTYGSGFPIPAFLSVDSALASPYYDLSSQRNRVRLGPYQRADVRVNKTWVRKTWKTTLFAEVMNLTNRTNRRFDGIDNYATESGVAELTIDRMFPILPSIGIVFEH